MLEVDSDNNVVWEYEDPLINHDFYRMESGNTMYIKYVLVPDNIKNKVKGGIPVGATTPLWCDALDEVNLKGEVVWEWLAYEHLDPEIDVMCPLMHRPFSKFSYSRVVEINPKTNAIEWEYKDDPPFAFFSSNQGGCQRLPNGNTLITDSDAGRIFEVAHEGEIVWEFVNPSCSFDPVYGHNNIVPRAYRYALDYEGLEGQHIILCQFGQAAKTKDRTTEEMKDRVQSRLEQLGY